MTRLVALVCGAVLGFALEFVVGGGAILAARLLPPGGHLGHVVRHACVSRIRWRSAIVFAVFGAWRQALSA